MPPYPPAGEPTQPLPRQPQFLAPSAPPEHRDLEQDRLLSRVSGRPEPDAKPGRYNVGRLMRRFAGADEGLLAWVPQERPRYTGLGGTVLFTAVLALVSMTVAIGFAFHTRTPFIVVFSGLWFLLILNFDRWIVASPIPEHRWQRVPTIVVRMLMAFVFGVVIAEPLVLTVFNTAVSQKVQEIRAEEKAAYEGSWLACNPPLAAAPAPAGPAVNPSTRPSAGPSARAGPNPSAGAAVRTASPTPTAPAGVDCANFHIVLPDNVSAAESQLTQAGTQQATNEATLAKITAEHEKLVKAANDDCTGVNGHYGKGPVCTDLRAAAAAYWKDHDGAKLESDVAAGRARVTTLQQQVTTLRDNWGDQRAATITKAVNEWAAGRGQPGLLERIEALNALAVKHASLALGIWAVRLLFILVDLAPALAKFASGTTTYDRLVSANLRLGEVRNRAHRVATEEDTDSWMDETNEERTVNIARRRAARDADVDAMLDDTASRQWPTSNGRGRPVGPSTYRMPEDRR